MSDTNVPLVDEAYILRVYTDLANMDVDLDSDPLRYGPKRLNGKVAMCRRHLTRCQQMFLQLSEDLQKINRAHRSAKLDFDLQVQDMFANDPDTRSGRNVRDREAIASVKLRAEREAISGLESSQEDLNTVMSVVKAKREDLKDVQGRIRDQIKLCQEEMGLGGKWGSAPPPGATPVDLDALRPVFSTSRGGVPTPTPAPESEVSDLEAFIASEVGSDFVEENVEVGTEYTESVTEAEPEPLVEEVASGTTEVPALEEALHTEVLRLAETDVTPASILESVDTASEPLHYTPAPSVEDFDLDEFLSTETLGLPASVILQPVDEAQGVARVPEVQAEPVAPDLVEVPEEPVILPAIVEVKEPAPTVSKAEVDAFFDDLDLSTVVAKPTKSVAVDEFDLNDILGGLV